MRIQNSKFKIQNWQLLLFFLSVFSCSPVFAQSNDQNFPTPITTNEISGVIKARDLGDGRSTIYFYAFNGTQGDVFVNIQTENLNGDIDVFTVEGLKSLTKIVVYADASDNETGRVIYLRKPEKLLLRIEGRSPNDDAAKFRIKFAGSFAALTDADKREVPAEPTVKSANDSDIKVNSVGTIINIKPKPTPAPKEAAVKEKSAEVVKEITVEKNSEKTVIAETVNPETKPEITVEQPTTATKPEVVVTENTTPALVEKTNETAVVKEPEKTLTTEKPAAENTTAEKSATKSKIAKEKPIKTPTKSERKNAERKKAADEAAALKNSETAKLAAALANLKLIIQFKDGTKTERPMTEVLKVGVDNGVLTVITKDGNIGRYSIVDVAKFAIE